MAYITNLVVVLRLVLRAECWIEDERFIGCGELTEMGEANPGWWSLARPQHMTSLGVRSSDRC